MMACKVVAAALGAAALAGAAKPAHTAWLQQAGNDWRDSSITRNLNAPGAYGYMTPGWVR